MTDNKKTTNYRPDSLNDPLKWVDEQETENTENAEIATVKAKPKTVSKNEDINMSEQAAVLSEVVRLTKAFEKGSLSERANVTSAQSEMLNALNTMLDAILLPMVEGNRVLRSIHGGDLRDKVEIECFGEHKDMKDTINGIHSWLTDLVAYVTKISSGDLTAEMAKASDKDQIHEWLVLLKKNIQALINDANMLSIAAVEGRLSTRADATQHQGDFRKIVEGVNNTLDAVINPLNVAADYVDNISKGAIPAKITDRYNGDFNILKNNLNTCIDAVNSLVKDAEMLSAAAVEGRLATRADATKHQGDFRKIVEGVNNTLDAVINPLNVAADYVDNISKGAIPAKITDRYNGDFNVLKNNLNTCIDALNGLLAARQEMSRQHELGMIDEIMPVEHFQGAYAEMAGGINTLVQSHISVKMKVVEVVSKYAIGDLSVDMDRLPGKKALITTAIDNVKKNIQSLNEEIMSLVEAAKAGKLSTRGAADKFQFSFKEIVEGINATLDAVIVPLNVAADYVNNISKGMIPAKITDSYNGDFNILKNNLNTCIDAVNTLVADANMLSIAAVEGRLSTRADASKHQGDFRKIVEGVNNTLDAVIAPLNSIAAVIDLIGNNDLSANLSGEFRGDFARIKDSLDNALQRLNTSLYQIVDTVDQVSQSAEQLSNASHNMAATSEQQSSAVEEVTSAIEETDSQVRANTDNANAANQLVMSTSQAASQGQQKMQAMSEAMNAINDSSQSIAKIIKVIDEIAFQTNLLALNAAVEAARAGQHGRGFAVVAQEVRNLAGRSAKAARETADLIEDSTKRVKDGVNIAGETGNALDQIVTNVIKVKDLVAEIATASVEQSRGVSQINVAMGQVASAARSGSKQAEELSSASSQLTSIANQTQHELSRFKLRERQANLGLGGLSLENLSPELLRQLQALLSANQAPVAHTTSSAKPALVQLAPKTAASSTTGKKSPKQVMPLDQDERGFGDF